MRKLKIGITGAGGFIGSHLVKALTSENVDVILTTGQDRNVETFPNTVVADILHINQLKKHLAAADVIVHLAGLNSVGESFEDPMKSFNVNTIGTISLLDVCKDLGVKDVVIISSAEVYGRPVSNPVSEGDLLKPLSPYGVSKVAIEQICFVYHVANKINFKILRPFSIYGPNMSRKSLLYQIYKQSKAENDICLFNCSSVRDYCYVEDLILAIKKALFSHFYGFDIYNIGTGIGTNSKQLAELVQSILRRAGEIKEKALSDRPKQTDINHLVASIDKAWEELEWKPQVSLQDGLKKTIKSFANE